MPHDSPAPNACHNLAVGAANTPHSDGYNHCNILYYCAMYMSVYMYVYATTTSQHTYHNLCTLCCQGVGVCASRQSTHICVCSVVAHTQEWNDMQDNVMDVSLNILAAIAGSVHHLSCPHTLPRNTRQTPRQQATFTPILCMSSTFLWFEWCQDFIRDVTPPSRMKYGVPVVWEIWNVTVEIARNLGCKVVVISSMII